MKKCSVMIFAVLLGMLFTMPVMAKEIQRYSWKQTDGGVWQVWDSKEHVTVKDAIIKEASVDGPGATYYYVVLRDGAMATVDGEYFDVAVTINRIHDGTYGRIVTGSEELVKKHAELIVDMNAKINNTATATSAELAASSKEVTVKQVSTNLTTSGASLDEITSGLDLNKKITHDDYDLVVKIFEAAPTYRFGKRYLPDTGDDAWSVNSNGTYYGDFTDILADSDGIVVLSCAVKTTPKTEYYWINSPTVGELVNALEKLH